MTLLPLVYRRTAIDFLAPPSGSFLVRLVAAKHGVPVSVLKGPGQTRPVVKIRNEAIRLAYTHTRLSSTQIGTITGRDHATVLYSLGRSSKGNARGYERMERFQ